MTGKLPTASLPMVLGHEGAGIVVDVGPDVTGIVEGDHVVMSFKAMCGSCFYCRNGQLYLCEKDSAQRLAGTMPDGTTRLRRGHDDIRQLCQVGSLCDEVVVPAASAVRLPDHVPFAVAAPLGCGVMTGVGAALNTACLTPGATVAVIGCGGVGLSAMQGARIAGASRIIAIDTVQSKLDISTRFGATDTINGATTSVVDVVREMTKGRGVDAAFEAVGLATTIGQAIEMVRPGGEAVLVGLPGSDVNLPVHALGLITTGKSLKGSLYGSCHFSRDVCRILDLYEGGRIDLDGLISQKIALEDVNEAFESMVRGEVVRSVVVHQH